MKKVLCKVVTIAMLVTMFSTVVNLCTASAAPNDPLKAVTNHHKHPSKPVKPPKTPKCATPTPTATETLLISAGSVNSKPGEEICVPVNFRNVPADGIGSTDISISYDPSKLEYIDGSAGSIVPDPDSNFAVAETSPGVLKLLFVDTTNLYKHICTDGVFANLNFKVTYSGPTATSIKIYDITVGDGNLVNVPTTAVEGIVGILETTPKPTIPCNTTPPPPYEPLFTPTFTPPPPVYHLSISVEGTITSPNENIYVPIYFDHIPEGISTCNFEITYDPKQLEYISYEPGSIVPNPTNNFEVNKAKDGSLKLLFLDYTMGSEYIKSGGIVTNLNFKVIGTSYAVTYVNISNSTVADLNLNPLTTDIYPGKVTIYVPVEGTPTPTVTVTPTPALSSFEITVASKQASPNENITLPVYFDDIPAAGIGTCDLTITYDPKQLEFLSGEPGSIVPNPDTNFAINKDEDGRLKLLFLDYTMGSEYIKSGGIVANLNFKVIGSSYEVTHINLPNPTIGDSNLNRISTTLYPGSVIIDIPSVQTPTCTPTCYTPCTPIVTPSHETDFCCKVGSADAKIGDIVTIPVNFENVPDKGIVACDMTITYDSTQLEYVDFATGSIVNNPDINFKINKMNDGTIKILFLDNTMKDEYITSNGLFTNLNFKVLPTKCGTTQINVVDSTFVDIDLNTINTAIVPGFINVICSSGID